MDGMGQKTDSLPTTAGNYYLKNDILIDGQFEINESVNICLNGKKIRAGSSIPENRYMLTVKGSNARPLPIAEGTAPSWVRIQKVSPYTGRDPTMYGEPSGTSCAASGSAEPSV